MKQSVALAGLLSGANDREAAERAGVARESVTRWRRGHPEFARVLARGQSEITETAARSLRDLVPLALDAIRDALVTGPPAVRLRAAVAVLGPTLGVAPTEPETGDGTGARIGRLLDSCTAEEVEEVARTGRLPLRIRLLSPT